MIVVFIIIGPLRVRQYVLNKLGHHVLGNQLKRNTPKYRTSACNEYAKIQMPHSLREVLALEKSLVRGDLHQIQFLDRGESASW